MKVGPRGLDAAAVTPGTMQEIAGSGNRPGRDTAPPMGGTRAGRGRFSTPVNPFSSLIDFSSNA